MSDRMPLNTHILITAIVLISLWMPAAVCAQFVGGNADGFGFDHAQGAGDLFQGSNGDGFAVDIWEGPGLFYRGQAGDGFARAMLQAPGLFYRGHSGDGYAGSEFSNPQTLYAGASSDGFSRGQYLYYHVWTGLVGTGWLIAGNWTDNIIPTEDLRVRIPATAPNMPAINAGFFKIGTEAGADYTCKALWIESGADLLGRINAFIENHSLITIDGTLRWKNQATNSFINAPGAEIIVTTGGILMTDH